MEGHFRRSRAITFAGVVAGLAALGFGNAALADSGLPSAVSPVDFYQALNNSPDGTVGVSASEHPSGPICTTSNATWNNVPTDKCGAVAPHNETSLAVNPTDEQNIIGSANDYELRVNSAGRIYETLWSRAHVTFDGGKTWTLYGIDNHSYKATGDPGVAFDADGRAYISTLGFVWDQSARVTSADILVAHSTDGGRTWAEPSLIAHGTGNTGSVGLFNDKEYIAAWGHGNAIVTWSAFFDGFHGGYLRSPIYDSVTHDGGVTWSAPQEISGSAPFCTGGSGGAADACNQDQFSTPAVTSDGRVFVSFENYAGPASSTTANDQYLVVQVDPATGARVAGPAFVQMLVDSNLYFPANAFGEPTLQDSQFRTNSAGSLAADPTNPDHLAVIWADMRNSPPAAPNRDPYSSVTNQDVGFSESYDGGRTWSAATVLAIPHDQTQPWGTFDSTGRLRIGFFDRSYDALNHEYGYTLATETAPGSRTFTYTDLTQGVLSQPTMNDRFFGNPTVNPAYPHPSHFNGDYTNVATDYHGGVVALWTDQRDPVCFTVRCGWGEYTYFSHG